MTVACGAHTMPSIRRRTDRVTHRHAMNARSRPIDSLYTAAARAPDRIAIAGPGESVSYAELVVQIDALASAFQSIDPSPGSRVGICARNTPEHLIALLATYAAGKTWVPLNPRNGRAELDAMIVATCPTLIVADRSCLDRFTPPDAPLIVAQSDGAPLDLPSVQALIATWAGAHPAPVERGDEDPQIIKFSGGSTGAPKAVVQPVRCLRAQERGIREFFALDADDVNLIAAPLTHGASCFVLPILTAGGRHVLVEEPKPATVLDAMQGFGVTTCYAPPTLIYAMLEHHSIGTRRFPALKHLIYSAAPMPPGRIREAQRIFGPVIETAYGQVEAPQIVAAMRAAELASDENLASIGRPTPFAGVSIMGVDGALAPAGEVGEIVVKGPLVMTEYLDQPTLTAQTLIAGWLHTGDLGYIDSRGYIYIRGRLRDVINSGGFKVFPGDVETALMRDPAVAECCVFGVDDPKWGEAVHAAVVLVTGAETTAGHLIAVAKDALDSVKAPKRIYFVKALPRNAAGKVSRADVRRAVATLATAVTPGETHTTVHGL